MKIPKIIVSANRPQRVSTTKHISGCMICVPESQKEEYERHNNVPIITHPDSVKGLSPKRQWIYEKFGDVFMLDDDIMGMNRIFQTKYSDVVTRLTPEEAENWIDATYEICKDMNIKFFGVARSASPVSYKGFTPIEMTTMITAGAFGLLKDDKLFFPDWPEFVAEDYWINALHYHFNRKAWIDNRYAFSFRETEVQQGGVAIYRTEDLRRKSFLYLKKHFGSAIILKNKFKGIKKNIMKNEKSLVIPF